ncbi:MAG: DUF2914 domain-containing protein [Nitrospirota bacterium]|nr:DUF2914 domain-containing protein [Nitrospirota bacterium]MDH5587387.1 DUF2914 domain-containing protein [Nitrospirota bacterium]MDH5774066.1 DUF2914 domain-containing protein [Nitrospirota bacterium]
MKGAVHLIFLCAMIEMGGMLMLSSPVQAESVFLVEKVVLAKGVTNRNPEGIFSPPAYCEKDNNEQAAIPIVKTSQTSLVMLWTKVMATTAGKLRHSWHHQIDGIWTKVSEVNLSIRPSSGYRMWSLKSLKPKVHVGEWMVVVSPTNQPEKILCITRFTVQ